MAEEGDSLMAGAGFATFFDDEALDAAFVRGIRSGVERVNATGSYVAFDQVQEGVVPIAQMLQAYLDHSPEVHAVELLGEITAIASAVRIAHREQPLTPAD